MTSSAQVRAAADLAALLPTDHPLAQLGRLRLDAAVREQENTMTTLSVSTFDHTHDATGHFIGGDMNPLQDGGLEPCGGDGCGRRIPDDAPAWHHARSCPQYSPHPLSVAYAKAQAAVATEE